MWIFQNLFTGNQLQILTDHKAIDTALTENRGNKTNQSRLTRWADRTLPFEYTIYDEQFVVKTIENFDEACRVMDTPATDKEIGKVQLVKAHLEKNRTNTKKLIFDVNSSERKYLASGAPEGGIDNPYKNFIQSDHRIRTAKIDKTFEQTAQNLSNQN